MKTLISELTDIGLEYVSVSFIYKYPTYAPNEWSKWKWITGKDSTSRVRLKKLIANKNSCIHYMISNNVVASFENDKSILIPQNYSCGEKDDRYSEAGSISSHKMSFSNNNEVFCTGYLTISTYGIKFYSDCNKNDKFNSAEDFKGFLYGSVIPSFRKIIETELGFLYMRHKYKKDKKGKKHK